MHHATNPQPGLLALTLAFAGTLVGCRNARAPAQTHTAPSTANDYRNPVDNRTYHAPQGWTRYGEASHDAGGIVRIGGVTLLTSDTEMRDSVPAAAIAEYIRRIAGEVEAFYAARVQGPGEDLLVQVELTPHHAPVIQGALRPEGSASPVDDLLHRIEALPAPESQRYPVRFQVAFLARGGTGEPLPGPEGP